MTPEQRRKRQHQHLLLAFTGIVAVWVGFVFFLIRNSEEAREHRAIRTLERLGGTVTEDHQLVPASSLSLRGGASVFAYATRKGAVSVRLDRRPIGDAELAYTRRLRWVIGLSLGWTHVSDAGMAEVARLAHLRWLVLDYTQVTDEGVAQLVGMRNLMGLSLRGTQVTDAGVVHLQGLASLRYLDLSETQVTDAGLCHLKNLTALQYLDMERVGVSERGVMDFQRALPDVQVYATGRGSDP